MKNVDVLVQQQSMFFFFTCIESECVEYGEDNVVSLLLLYYGSSYLRLKCYWPVFIGLSAFLYPVFAELVEEY